MRAYGWIMSGTITGAGKQWITWMEPQLPRGWNEWTSGTSLIQNLEKFQNSPKSRRLKTMTWCHQWKMHTSWNLSSWTKLLYANIKFPSVCVYKDVHERRINFMFRWDVKFFPQGSHYRYMKIFQILGNIRHLKHFWVPRYFQHGITPAPEKWLKPSQIFDLKLNPSLASSQDSGAHPSGT